MNVLQFGLSNFFSIIAPGALFLSALLLAMVAILHYHGSIGSDVLLGGLGEDSFLFSTVFFLQSFFFGVALRMFDVKLTEWFCNLYQRAISRTPLKTIDSFKGGADQPFPYGFVMDEIGNKSFGRNIKAFYEEKYPKCYYGPGNLTFFNYCKFYIRAHSPTRIEYLERLENRTRFLAGAFAASLFSLILSVIFAILFAFKEPVVTWLLLVWILAMICVIWIIVARFQFQRTKEVEHTWLGFYECVKEIEGARLHARLAFVTRR